MNYIRRKKLPVILDPEEAAKLLSIPDTRYLTGVRGKAVLALMINCGLRVSEVVNLKSGDLNLAKGKLRVIDGKGKVDRDLVVQPFTAALLGVWKQARPPGSKFFFTTIKNKAIADKGRVDRFASIKGSQMSVRYVQHMVKRYAKKVGRSDITPHTLRHTFATDFIRQGGSVLILQRILGHADISTTLIYIQLANIDVEKGMNGRKEITG